MSFQLMLELSDNCSKVKMNISCKHQLKDENYSALANFAFDDDFAFMQFNDSLHDTGDPLLY